MPEINTSEERSNAANDKWVAEYLKGNKEIPLCFFGINIYLLSAALEDRPEHWKKFSDSKLTEQQLETISIQMEGRHQSVSNNKSVNEGDLQKLWTYSKAAVNMSLYHYFGKFVQQSVPSLLYLREEVSNNIQQDLENNEKVEQLLTFLTGSKAILKTHEIRELSFFYRAAFDQDDSRRVPSRLQTEPHFKRRFEETGVPIESIPDKDEYLRQVTNCLKSTFQDQLYLQIPIINPEFLLWLNLKGESK